MPGGTRSTRQLLQQAEIQVHNEEDDSTQAVQVNQTEAPIAPEMLEVQNDTRSNNRVHFLFIPESINNIQRG